jgi:outer membrane protein assembly factor BamA
VGQVLVVGNERTKQNVILRQVPLYPGQVLTYPDLRAAERNLTRLNIFESSENVHPTVTVLDPENESEYKDLLVQVQETTTGSLLFGVGVNSDAGLNGSIVMNERNFDITRLPTSFDDLIAGNAFRGGGQEFRAEAVPGTQLQRYSVSWREPFLFDSQWSLGTNAFYFTRQYNEYQENRYGGKIPIGRRLNQYWSFNASVRAENVGVFNVQPWEPEAYTSVEGYNFQVGVRAGLVRDSRDSLLRATEGSLLDVGFEEMALTPSRCSTRNSTSTSPLISGPMVRAAMCWLSGRNSHGLAVKRLFTSGSLRVVSARFAASSTEAWAPARVAT